jgi:competence protein ComFC
LDPLLHRLSGKAGTGERLRGRIARRVVGWLKFADVLVYPSFCELCGGFLGKPGERVVCGDCLDRLRPCVSSFCPVCGRFFEGAGEPHLCGDCLNQPPPFARHRSSAKYEGPVKEVILLFKYRGYEILGKYLADLVGRSIAGEDDIWEGVDAIIPVPLHPKKLKKRGYNQAAVLSRHLSRLKGVKLLENCLIKARNNPAQTSLTAAERKDNVRGAYLVRKPAFVRGRILLLVDDVCTTGATLGECSRALKRAGAREVRAVTAARA